ncbi:MAG: sulfite exporter TauE/SafE family protein [Bryobacteraceae bacterium]|nr:sulfite exporter TauE/SafE family protein [Bryobacteraceae bacterium]
MTFLEVFAPLGLGVVSSLHCAGMCGPIVLAYTLPIERRRRLPLHLAYNAGRIATYAILGAVAGTLGGGMVTVGRMAGLERQAAILTGILMIAAGILAGGWLPKTGLVRIGAGPGVHGALSRAFGRFVRQGGVRSKFALGATMGLLPCGMVYAALVQAMSTSNALAGALSMALFGAGTSASLLAIGLLSGTVSARFGRYSTAVASLSVIALGAIVIWRGATAAMIPGSCH